MTDEAASSGEEQIWWQEVGEGPLVAAAIHAGHEVRDELTPHLALDEATRRREEDPLSDLWTAVAPTRLIGRRSRFEVDLNRPRHRAIYRTPVDAWGLAVWRSELPEALAERSLYEYDTFYQAVGELFRTLTARFGGFVVFDLHTYNYRRGGPDTPPADADPQVNLGTGTLDRGRWGRLVDRFLADLRVYDFPGGRLDVRENVKFRGGYFPRFIHRSFPASPGGEQAGGCALAIEVKKFFMDEWTGAVDHALVAAIGDALASTVPGVLEELERR